MRKLRLDLENLSVESFPTAAREPAAAGTVEANAAACTCNASCVCRTAYYVCGTGPFTIHSCDYTANRSCAYE